jgi:hypothetical protein
MIPSPRALQSARNLIMAVHALPFLAKSSAIDVILTNRVGGLSMMQTPARSDATQ